MLAFKSPIKLTQKVRVFNFLLPNKKYIKKKE